ncbi:MAG: hypothetical protein WAL56_23025 [Candidatus Sulfotelmatobacter sp.]
MNAIFANAILSKLRPSAFLLHSTEPIRALVWLAIGLCAGLYLFLNGFRLLHRRRLLLDTPTSKIRSAPMGMVELSGLATGPHTMIAPVTQRPCYYFRTLVWEWKQQGRNKTWVKVAAECMHVPFFLDDNTGQVLIDPRGAELDLHLDFHQEFSDSLFTTKEEVPPNVRLFLSRHCVDTSHKIKVEEYCIKPKNALFLMGTLGENPGLEVTARPIQDEEPVSLTAGGLSFPLRGASLSLATEGSNLFNGVLTGGLQHDPKFDAIYDKAIKRTSAQIIQLSPDRAPTRAADMTQQQKIAAALMQAGIANPAAWAAGGVMSTTLAASADSSAEGKTAPVNTFDSHPPVVIMKGKNNPTFLISWRSQRAIARSLSWKCTLMIWGGPALALLCLYGLITLTRLF